MYYLKWDPEVNGILLTDIATELTPPRPVFYEELDLLGFDKYWTYPKSNNPLLWSTNRRYYYKGELVATAKKGDALNLPELKIEKGYEDLILDEINIEEIIKRNKDKLFVLENKAIDFIEEVCSKYQDYPFSVSFSGGKDSQVVLDLITRVIHSDDITVIFSDTTLEHDYTYSTIKKTLSEYKEQFPDLKFHIAKPPKPAKELFKEMGLPSRFQRWCTPILKTAPYNKLINNLVEDSSKIIVFEGVRAEESPRRSKYKPIADGVKHPSIINCRPILKWNFSEVILYNFYRNLPLNPLYRYGLSRVGCELCPFSSGWSELIYNHIDDKFKNEYFPFIEEYAKNRGLSSEEDLKKFISEGNWKPRAGGLGITTESRVDFKNTKQSFKSISIKPNENFLEWIKILGEVTYHETKNKIKGELRLDEKYISFTIIKKENKEIIEFFNIQKDIRLQNKIKRILNKSTFCIHCGVCDVECPQKAIQTIPEVHINSNLCENCENCINFVAEGCYRAKSVNEGSGAKNMNRKTTKIDKYSSFGLRQPWLDEFFEKGDEWLENNSLGTKQVPAVRNWLMDAELIDSDKKLTQLGSDLTELYKKDPTFVWGIMWINLYYNSKIVNWYCNNVEWGANESKSNLLENLMNSFPDLKKGTLNNPLTALINTFDTTSFLFDLGSVSKEGRERYVAKYGFEDEIDVFLVAYSLYKLKEEKSRTDFTVSEIYSENFEGGPYKIFGLSQNQFERILRGLQESKEFIVKTDLTADLDNIFLNEAYSANDLIKFKKEEI